MSDAERQNIENLTGFWRRMGATSRPLPGSGTVHVSDSWPHRRWVEWSVDPDARQAREMADLVRDDVAAVVPLWHGAKSRLPAALRDVGFRVGFELLAMRRRGGPEPTPDRGRLQLRPVTHRKAADEWTRVASASFGYEVDPAVIRDAVDAPGLDLLIARLDDEAVGTVSLFDDATVTGVHMMGVLPSQRRRGHARSILHHALAQAAAEYGRDIVLQASAAGAPLYRSMGFEAQFSIPHYVLEQGTPGT